MTLNEEYRLPYIADLANRKITGGEKGTLAEPETDFHRNEYERLVAQLESSSAKSALPDLPSSGEAFNDLLVRVRLTLG